MRKLAAKVAALEASLAKSKAEKAALALAAEQRKMKESKSPSSQTKKKAGKATFMPTIDLALDQVQSLSYDHIYRIFFNKATSDVRTTHYTNIFADPKVTGKCITEHLSGNSCGAGQPWGHRAFNYGCSAENQVEWHDPWREKIGVHGQMSLQCAHKGKMPKSCQIALCHKKEATGNTHEGLAFVGGQGEVGLGKLLGKGLNKGAYSFSHVRDKYFFHCLRQSEDPLDDLIFLC